MKIDDLLLSRVNECQSYFLIAGAETVSGVHLWRHVVKAETRRIIEVSFCSYKVDRDVFWRILVNPASQVLMLPSEIEKASVATMRLYNINLRRVQEGLESDFPVKRIKSKGTGTTSQFTHLKLETAADLKSGSFCRAKES